MTQEREALKLALEALRKARRKVLTTEECHAVIMSIKEALAQPEQIPPSAYSNTHQPEQEPVAWINFCGFTREMTVDFDCESELASIPLYKKEQL